MRVKIRRGKLEVCTKANPSPVFDVVKLKEPTTYTPMVNNLTLPSSVDFNGLRIPDRIAHVIRVDTETRDINDMHGSVVQRMVVGHTLVANRAFAIRYSVLEDNDLHFQAFSEGQELTDDDLRRCSAASLVEYEPYVGIGELYISSGGGEPLRIGNVQNLTFTEGTETEPDRAATDIVEAISHASAELRMELPNLNQENFYRAMYGGIPRIDIQAQAERALADAWRRQLESNLVSIFTNTAPRYTVDFGIHDSLVYRLGNSDGEVPQTSQSIEEDWVAFCKAPEERLIGKGLSRNRRRELHLKKQPYYIRESKGRKRKY
jgi:hypothetical protein